MTITEESTSRVTDPSSAPPPTASSSPSLFQRICCCCSSDLKEPPVQLIRSGSLTYQQGAAVTSAPESSAAPPSNNVISAAKKSVDDDVARPQTSQKPKEDGDVESVNMNDILMESVLKSTEEDRTEEIDENELRNALKKAENDSNEGPKLKGRSGISKELQSGSESSDDEGHGDNRKMSVIEFIRSEAKAETSTTLPSPLVKNDNEKMSEATQSEMSDSEEEEEESDSGKQVSTVGMSSKTTARAERNSDAEERRVLEFKELSSDESLKGTTEDEEEEIILEKEEDVPPPLPLSPPPRLSPANAYGQPEGSPIPPPRSPLKSRMYANADDDSDEDSDDEESGDAHPIASNGLVRMHPMNFASHKDQDGESVSSDSSVSTATDLSEKENDEEVIGVTRISVKSDGRAEIHSPKSPVRVTLEPDRHEVTDDDFSEKLI
ncbi:unnamed protein product [Caenorhabditis sp. 36 PRJEB53466]|nr:unnamed protein product [Caenorhabditis sp. 36 PRJEB53466]